MGLLDMLMPGNPFSGWLDQNRGKVTGAFSGLAGAGNDPRAALQGWVGGLQHGVSVDQENSIIRQKQAEQQAAIDQQKQEQEQITSWLQQNRPDLAALPPAERRGSVTGLRLSETIPVVVGDTMFIGSPFSRRTMIRYTYGDAKWFPAMDPAIRAMFNKVTIGALEGTAGVPAREMFKINGEYVNTPVVDGKPGVVGIPFLDRYIESAALEYLDKAAVGARAGKPFFLSVNFMKVHQPNLPDPEFQDKSLSKTKFADSVVEVDTRIGRVMAKLKALGLDSNTLVVFTTDNGAWQDVYPDAGYTPFRGTKGTVREGGSRVPAIAVWPGHIPAGAKNHEVVGGTDWMATFASVGGAKLPTADRDGKPTMFDSFDLTPMLTGQVKESPRKNWFYFTENELSPGAIRIGHLKMTFNLRGDNGAQTGGLSVDSNLGWKGQEKYVAVVPQLFDLWQDPQERYDVVMNAWGDNTWVAAIMGPEIDKLMKTYVQYPPRKLQSGGYTGPITISNYQKFNWVREQLAKDGVVITLPSGN